MNIRVLLPVPIISCYHLFWAFAGALIYRFPSRNITVVGVTGTKGKTTVTELLARILETAEHKVAVANGLHFRIGDREELNNLKITMPGRGKLQNFLRDAVNAKCKYAVIEITSEGIKQHRHRFIKFEVAALTNLQKEHLESHGSFEAYRAAKAKLFIATKNIHVLNLDDKNFEYFRRISAKTKFYYTLEYSKTKKTKGTVVVPEMWQGSSGGMTFSIDNQRFETKLIGKFNLANILCAIAIARALRVGWDEIRRAVLDFPGVPGRMQFIQKEPFTLIVDLAHTPDSLEAVCKTVRSTLNAKRLICVLGAAGGGRDRWKRPVMGALAAEYCDRVILTSEDPYDEDPNQILSEIKSGIPNDKIQMTNLILDRREAIEKAISLAERGDAVIITGKGSERWITLAGGKKIPWSDVEIAKEALLEIHRNS